MVEPACWTITEWEYECKAWTKRGAWKQWLTATKKHPHYASYEYRHSYRYMRKDITRCSENTKKLSESPSRKRR